MRIVQTFWTAGKDPLRESFGWLHPEYNLMSWALSCLSLRSHYDEVALYTDSVGKQLLIDKLKLPYTEVNVVFDDFKCLPQHWALSKIKTYSLQTGPFLHVDGDVYRADASAPYERGALYTVDLQWESPYRIKVDFTYPYRGWTDFYDIPYNFRS